MKKERGSIMIYVLITLSILLVVSFSVISVSDSQTRSAINTDKSVVAFFLAESGAEILLDRIYSGTYDAESLSSLYDNCADGMFTNTLDSGTWTATFYDTDGDHLSSCSSTSWRSEADEMKIDGNHSNTIRSVRMSIEPPPLESGGTPAVYVRSNTNNDDTVELDIGEADTDRLVVVFAAIERGNNRDSEGITVDGNECTLTQIAYNTTGIGGPASQGPRIEMWYCDEDDLGSSSGTVTVALENGNSSWATHALLFTGASQDGPADSGIDQTSDGSTTTVSGIDVAENGLVLMGVGHQGTSTISSWTSPLDEKTDENPQSARSYTASGIEATSQTSKSYIANWSGGSDESTGIVASWDPIE